MDRFAFSSCRARAVFIFVAVLSAGFAASAQEEMTSTTSQPAATPPLAKPSKAAPETTPVSLPGAETFIYRQLQPEPLRLHVFKPDGWQAADRRPAFIWFFGGGWDHGTPEKSASWAKWAADLGLVGVAPDYRTKKRFGTSPLQAVADGRLAMRWVEDHAAELGVDPQRIVVGGASAGGHLALWTAITHTPPGSATNEAPHAKPIALILMSAVSDTSMATGYTPKRFGTNASALSPVHQLDTVMPPMLVFHGDADTTVTNRQSIVLHEKLVASSNLCQFVIVPGGNHNFTGQLPEWKDKSRDLIQKFLTEQKILPVQP